MTSSFRLYAPGIPYISYIIQKSLRKTGGSMFNGADYRIRTYDLLITNELLYQLS